MYDTPIKVDLDLVYQSQRKSLEILHAIDDLCKKHGIKYSLFHGSMLAAVKYHKFIPWDDDCDIFMIRSEFEKFVQHVSELPSNLFFQTKETDPYYHNNVRKVRMNNTKLITLTASDNEKYHQGIFVDIFVGDYYPDWSLPIIKVFSWAPNLKQKRKQYPRGSFKRALYSAVVAPIYLVHTTLEKIWLATIVPLFRKNPKHRWVGVEAILNDGTFYRKDDWEPVVENIMFENSYFPIANGYDKILKSMYGDNYMEYEPKDSEKHWHARKIEINC